MGDRERLLAAEKELIPTGAPVPCGCGCCSESGPGWKVEPGGIAPGCSEVPNGCPPTCIEPIAGDIEGGIEAEC